MKLSGKNLQSWAEFEVDISGLTVVTGPSDVGKCLALGTPVLMYNGTIKPVEQVQIGDMLMGPDSKPRRVLSLAHGWDEMYEIAPNKGKIGAKWACNKNHILSLMGRRGRRVEISAADLFLKNSWFKLTHHLHKSGTVVFEPAAPVFEPYLVGYWLGDGTTDLHKVGVCTADNEVADFLDTIAEKYKLYIRKEIKDKGRNSASDYSFTTRHKGDRGNSVLNTFRQQRLVLNGEKTIPNTYLTGSVQERLDLLAGLIDSDGYNTARAQKTRKGCATQSRTFEFTNKLDGLVFQVAFLARSLGFQALVNKKYAKRFERWYYTVSILGNLPIIPTKIQRKKAIFTSKKNPLLVGFKIKKIGFGEYFGFELDGDGLFLLGDFTVTHNSALFRALKGVLRNELPADWVRNGQDDQMEVVLELDGHRIEAARKRKGSTAYVIDGKPFSKLDKAVPEDLEKLKFGEVLIGDFDVDPIFARQNSAQFLIDPLTYKPTEVNAVLGAFGGTEKLEHGKKEANLRKTQKDAEARTIAAQIRDAEERRAKLTDMQLIGDQIACCLSDLDRGIRGLESGTGWLGEAIRHRQEIVKYRQILDAFVLPDIAGLEQEYRLALFAEQAAESNAYAKWLAKPIAALSSTSTHWDNVGRLRSEIVALETALRAKRHAAWLSEATSALETTPAWADARRLWNEIAILEAAVEAGGHVVSTDKLKSSLSGVEEPFNEAVLLWSSIRRLESLGALMGELAGSADRLAEVEAELLAAQAELQKGLCPKCGRPREHVCQ